MLKKKAVKASKKTTVTASDKPLSSGDWVRVHTKIKEGNKERVQMFEGIVLSLRGRGENKTMTVRRQSLGVGIERIWPLASPLLVKIDIVKRGDFRRSKLYYLRHIRGHLSQVI